jgi:hypothetical protein
LGDLIHRTRDIGPHENLPRERASERERERKRESEREESDEERVKIGPASAPGEKNGRQPPRGAGEKEW